MIDLTLDQWHALIANEIDATPVDADIPDMTEMGKADCVDGLFQPPSCMSLTYDEYIIAWNNEWARVNNRRLSR